MSCGYGVFIKRIISCLKLSEEQLSCHTEEHNHRHDKFIVMWKCSVIGKEINEVNGQRLQHDRDVIVPFAFLAPGPRHMVKELIRSTSFFETVMFFCPIIGTRMMGQKTCPEGALTLGLRE